MIAIAEKQEVNREIKYSPHPSLRLFHESPAFDRAIIGQVGSGKTSAASMEIGWYLPRDISRWFARPRTRWAVVRNTYRELMDTTLITVREWFPSADWNDGDKILTIRHRCDVDGAKADLIIEMLFRSCDRVEDVKKFKSLDITGYWVDESCEVAEEIKLMLAGRAGRYPKYIDPVDGQEKPIPVKYGIETSNPPDIEQPLYSNYSWDTRFPVPGPISERQPLEGHYGIWQPKGENDKHLQVGYHADLRKKYRDYPDWIDMYLDAKPGVIIRGRLVYANFRRDYHEAKAPLVWANGALYRGWDNTGNCPACIVGQIPTAGRFHVLKEFHTERLGIVDFTRMVVESCNIAFPGGSYADYGDPAGANKFSNAAGGLTSNAELMAGMGVRVVPSDQNFTARVQAVDQLMGRIDGLLIDPSCTRLINGFLGGYCYPEIGTSGVYGEKPLKNKFSHPHDALQYLVVKLFGNTRAPSANVDIQKLLGRTHAYVSNNRNGGEWMH